MTENMTKQRLLTLLDDGRGRWEKLLAEVGESRMTLAGVVEDWSVKDIVAHVAFWERWVSAKVRSTISGQPPSDFDLYGVESLPPDIKQRDTDGLNEWVFEQHRRRVLPEVLMEEQTVYRNLFTMLRGLPDADLLVPGRFEWTYGTPMWQYVADNTYEHWAEHGQSIRAWLVELNTRPMQDNL